MQPLQWRCRCRLPAAVALIVVATAGPAVAQETPGTLFVVGVAYERGGPGPSLVRAMDELGLNDPAPGGEAVHPYYVEEGIDVALRLGMGYRFDNPLSVEVVVTNGPRGHARGYSRSGQGQLLVSYASVMVAAGLRAHLGPLSVEAGPVFNTTGWDVVRKASRSVEGRTLAVGGSAAAALSLTFGRLTVSLTGGYRDFPEVDLFEVTLPMRLEYDTFFVGLTTSSRID